MFLILYLHSVKKKTWPLNLPAADIRLSVKDNYYKRENYILEIVALAKIETALLLHKEFNYYFCIEVKASVQPSDFDTVNDMIELAPVVKMKRQAGQYSNKLHLGIKAEGW